MREIKFRGYSKLIGKYVYGYLLKRWSIEKEDFVDDEYIILSKNNNNYYDVEEDSVGQYTGFTDKNSEEIYEGDILDCGFGIVKRVCFVDGRWISMCSDGRWISMCSEDKKYDSDLLQDVLSSMCEVIGNIYEDRLKG